MENVLRENLLSLRRIEKVKETFWKSFLGRREKIDTGIKIVLLNCPCNGFGDLIFALKLSDYLKEWYNANVTIATTLEKGLLDLGADKNSVVGLVNKKGKASLQCRRFRYLSLNKEIQTPDLIFVAPMQVDYSPSYEDVKFLIPGSNKLNTFFFSEYNDTLNKKFDFNTGVGGKRDGIFLTTIKKVEEVRDTYKLGENYSLIYIAKTLARVSSCVYGFLELIASKYDVNVFQIIVPDWFEGEGVFENKKFKLLTEYYDRILLREKGGEKVLYHHDGSGSRRVLIFRADILPVGNVKMISLLKGSVDDILLTGDQSITDGISCCPEKTIWYQIAPWKTDLAKNLAKEIPNKYYLKKSLSCGTVKAVNYKHDHKNFSLKWDFRRKSKEKMDAILLSATIKNEGVALIRSYILSSKTLLSLKKKLRK